MNRYILSIDPSLKNTGFVLWENNIPIKIMSYCFNKFNKIVFNNTINKFLMFIDNLDIKIERGTYQSSNGKGAENQNILRGWLCASLNTFIKCDEMISPSSWQSFYKDEFNKLFELNTYQGMKKTDIKKLKEKIWILIANNLIKEKRWKVEIKNIDEAHALLMGWYAKE